MNRNIEVRPTNGRKNLNPRLMGNIESDDYLCKHNVKRLSVLAIFKQHKKRLYEYGYWSTVGRADIA